MLPFLKKSPKEEEIILGLQTGAKERNKWERLLYEKYFYLINHGSRKYRINEEDASSVYSDAIICVIDNIVSHRFEGRASLKTYVFQIFMNKCVDAIRKNTTKKRAAFNDAVEIDSIALLLPDRSQNIIEQIIKKNDQGMLMAKVKELGEKCRQILLMFEDGFSDKEIALEMSYNSAEVVKTSRMRCLEKLRVKVITKEYE